MMTITTAEYCCYYDDYYCYDYDYCFDAIITTVMTSYYCYCYCCYCHHP